MRPPLPTLLASSIITTALAFPHHSPDASSLEPRSVNCTDLGAPLDASCWATLDLSNWLTNWNKTTPTCTQDQDGANCCLVGEAWNRCFLRLAHGSAGSDCTNINLQPCTWTQYLAVSHDIAPQVFYIMTNIYSINNFFTNWFLALNFASAQAALIIPSLIALVDPEKQTKFALGNILTALVAGLAFLTVPEISAAALGIEATTAFAAKALVTGLQQAPGVAKAIWPSGTLNSQIVQIGDLASMLGQVDSQAGDMINAGLNLLMTDVPSFVKFASTGGWSGGTPYSLPATVKGIDLGLKTFLVSTAMGKNGKTLVGPKCKITFISTDDASLHPLGCIPESVPAVGTYRDHSELDCDSSTNICKWANTNSMFWNSTVLGQAYAVEDGHLDTIVGDGWTQLDLLFDGAFKCASSLNFDKELPINFAANGTLDFTCMSKLPECWSGVSCPITPINGSCPFAACPNWPN